MVQGMVRLKEQLREEPRVNWYSGREIEMVDRLFW